MAPEPVANVRTRDPLPEAEMVGLGRLELPTSRLSSARSNQLSYKPGGPACRPPAAGAILRNNGGTGLVREEREKKTAASCHGAHSS